MSALSSVSSAGSERASTAGPDPISSLKSKRRGIRVSPALVASVQAGPGAVPIPVQPAPIPVDVGPRRCDLLISDIRIDSQVQQRDDRLSTVLVSDYAVDIVSWLPTCPVVVFHQPADSGAAALVPDRFWLSDGFYRVAAAIQAGLNAVPCVVHLGGRRDAILHACGANARYGVRRTSADKRRAIKTLLSDIEWSLWSDRVIAERVGCHHDLVGSVRDPSRVSNTKRCELADSASSRQFVSGVDVDLLAPLPVPAPSARVGKDGKLRPVPALIAPNPVDLPFIGGYSAHEIALCSQCCQLAAALERSMQDHESVAGVVARVQALTTYAGKLVSMLRDRVSAMPLSGQ